MEPDSFRTVNISLPDIIDREGLQSIKEILAENNLVLSFQINEHTLTVEYAFPALSFSDIWKFVKDHSGYRNCNTPLRWRYDLLASMELNEQQHQMCQYGWQHYLTDIYVTYREIAIQDSNRKKLWQNYNRPKKQTTPQVD